MTMAGLRCPLRRSVVALLCTVLYLNVTVQALSSGTIPLYATTVTAKTTPTLLSLEERTTTTRTLALFRGSRSFPTFRQSSSTSSTSTTTATTTTLFLSARSASLDDGNIRDNTHHDKRNDMNRRRFVQDNDHQVRSSTYSYRKMMPRLGTTTLSRTLAKQSRAVRHFGANYWWSLPMGLVLIPIYSGIFRSTLPGMPSWWPLTDIDQVMGTTRTTTKAFKFVMGCFLSSNAAYFACATHLYFRLRQGLLIPALVLASGSVSTIFHTVQAFGSFRTAEALGYLDHAVAISTILCFAHRYGLPRVRTSLLSALGFITLSITGPAYPWLHSAWHCLSAGAAVSWAYEGDERI